VAYRHSDSPLSQELFKKAKELYVSYLVTNSVGTQMSRDNLMRNDPSNVKFLYSLKLDSVSPEGIEGGPGCC
jgi:hypothetical protein